MATEEQLLTVLVSTLLNWYYKVRSENQYSYQKPSDPDDDKNK